jgi:hypothetical protein
MRDTNTALIAVRFFPVSPIEAQALARLFATLCLECRAGASVYLLNRVAKARANFAYPSNLRLDILRPASNGAADAKLRRGEDTGQMIHAR